MFFKFNKTIMIKNTWIILLALALSSCSSTKDKFEKDLPSLPSDWSSSYESMKAIDGWAQTFNDEE